MFSRMIEASQYHVAEATSDRRDNRMETQRAVRVPVARKEVRVVIDRETGREVFLVD